MLSFLFAGLAILPVMGVLVHFISRRINTQGAVLAARFSPLVAAALAVVCAFALFGVKEEAIVGGWMPVSLMGAPLLIAITPETAAIISALACVELARTLQDENATDTQRIMRALTLPALCLAVLAANMLTLFMGMGLVEMFSLTGLALSAKNSAARRDLFHHAIFQIGSLLLLAMGFLISMAAQSSLYFPLSTITPRSIPFFEGALLLRTLSLPLYPGAIANRSGRVATFILLMRLLGLNNALLTPGIVLVVWLAGLMALVRAAVTPHASIRALSAQTGALLLAIAPHPADPPAWVAAAVIAWLLGSELLDHPIRAARILGALNLFGLPLMLGFIMRSGIALADQPLSFGVWVLAMALLAFTLTRITLAPTPPQDPSPAHTLPPLGARLGALVMAAPLVIFGALPQILGLPTLPALITGQSAPGWLGQFVALGAGVGLAVLWPRWQNKIARPLTLADSALNFEWVDELLESSANRLGSPFKNIFVFLESEGILIWAVAAALIAVLISRPGGP